MPLFFSYKDTESQRCCSLLRITQLIRFKVLVLPNPWAWTVTCNTKPRRVSPCEAKLTAFWPGVVEPDSDLSPEHSSLCQILHPSSCLLAYPPPARTSRRVARRDVGQVGWGAASCPPSVSPREYSFCRLIVHSTTQLMPMTWPFNR